MNMSTFAKTSIEAVLPAATTDNDNVHDDGGDDGSDDKTKTKKRRSRRTT